jgi:hypothetical protein
MLHHGTSPTSRTPAHPPSLSHESHRMCCSPPWQNHNKGTKDNPLPPPPTVQFKAHVHRQRDIFVARNPEGKHNDVTGDAVLIGSRMPKPLLPLPSHLYCPQVECCSPPSATASTLDVATQVFEIKGKKVKWPRWKKTTTTFTCDSVRIGSA